MILADVRTYLSERGRAPLTDLVHRFETEPEAMRAMLDVWVRKGRVRQIDDGSGTCSGCCGCGGAPEVYEWVKRG